MKTKIFALMVAILCISMIFVACDKTSTCETHVDENQDGVCDVCEETITSTESDTETDAACTTHTDADANKICDACGLGLVSIEVQIPCEEETAADMVVAPIPEDAIDYADHILKVDADYTEVVKIENINGTYGSNLALLVTQDDDGNITRELIMIGENAAVTSLWKATDASSETSKTTYDLDVQSNWYVVTKTIKTPDPLNTTAFVTTSYTVTYYTFGGEKIGEEFKWSQTAVDENTQEALTTPTVLDIGATADLYVQYLDTVYVVDAEGKIIHKGNPETLVTRPTMDRVIGDFGYIATQNGVFVYDLTKWIECTLAYNPATDVEWDEFILADGKVLIVTLRGLPEDAITYDFINVGGKFDMDYLLMDPVAKTITEVEFGYYINNVMPVADAAMMNLVADAEGKNIMYISTIENGRVGDDVKFVLVDNDMKILGELKDNGTLIADNRYIKEIELNNGEILFELIDEKGEHIAYVNRSVLEYGYKVIGNAHYTYEDQLIINFEEYARNYGNKIYVKEIANSDDPLDVTEEYYLYNFDGKAPVKIIPDASKTNWAIVDTFDFGYVVSYDVTKDGATTTEYALYNNQNKVIFTTAAQILDSGEVSGNTYVRLTDGTLCLLK